MQVSWIDPEELARLAAELNGPMGSHEPDSWDLNTLPEFTADALMPQTHLPQQEPELAVAPPAPLPDLSHFRDRLRAIRSKAQDAGLLPPPQAPAPAPASPPPVAAPAPPAASPVPAAVDATISTAVSSAPEPPAAAPSAETTPIAQAKPDASPLDSLNLEGTLVDRLGNFITWAGHYAPSKEILLVDDHGELLWGTSAHPELALSAILAANVSLRTGAQTLTEQPATTVKLGEDRLLTVLPCLTRPGLVTLALLNASPPLSPHQSSHLRQALILSVEGRS